MLKSGQPQSQDDDIYDGVYVGVVTNNKDPDNLGKIKVIFPWMDGSTESHCGKPISPPAVQETV